MKILHVVPSYIPAWRYGGPIHSVHGLCKALASRGHEIDVATTSVDGPIDSDVPLGIPVDLDGVAVRYFASRRLRRLYYSPPMYRFMARGMQRWDLVHTHSVFLWPTSAAAHLARSAKVPYVLSPRGMLVEDLIKRRSPWLKKAWIDLFERRNVSQASAVHVTSSVEARELLALGLRPRATFDIPNGFDLPASAGAGTSDMPPGIPEQYALFLGRISWKKGLDRLVGALAVASDVNLVVAGNDEEDYWPTVARLATERGVADRIRYVGFVDGERKQALLANARMVVLPSYSENFGNVVLEAMAAGIPVVVTPEVGLAAQVASSQSGVVVGGEPASLGAAIDQLWRDVRRCASLGANGRTQAQAYSWKSIATRFEDQYRSLLDEHARRLAPG